MADGFVISDRDWPDFRLLMTAFRNNGRQLGAPSTDGRGKRSFSVYLARTSAAHAAGVEQAVNLCDPAFVELSPVDAVDAINDSGVEIPDDTKCYIARFAGKWRIFWADVCEA